MTRWKGSEKIVDENAPPPLQVAVVGAGAMGRAHLRTVSSLAPLANVVAVSDGDPEALEAVSSVFPDVRTYPSLKRLLQRETPDIVHVCTPPHTHVSLALTALREGCHVYVEKPVAPRVEEAQELLRTARERNLLVCPGHQLLFTSTGRRALERIGSLGRIVHVESYFSFQSSGAGWLNQDRSPEEIQLLDVLPHGVYPLLRVLEAVEPAAPLEIAAMDVGEGGTLHAHLRRGTTGGTIVVTLAGRPVESYLRLVGTRGTLWADFVRGSVRQLRGQGSSSVAKVLNPLREAGQLLTGTVAGVVGRLVSGSSYPGLAPLIETFYDAVRDGAAPPLDPDHIRDTVRVQEEVVELLESTRAGGTASSRNTPKARSSEPMRKIVVTGGTGFLGSALVRQLRRDRTHVRALARRSPPPWERIDGVEYLTVDLAEDVREGIFDGADAVIHCAAETAGGWDAHKRNSVGATEHVVRAAARDGVGHLVHVSSFGLTDSDEPSGNGDVPEDDPELLSAERSRELGAYVWGKVESERRARRLAQELGLRLTIVRPGAILDYGNFEAPGHLGRRIGPLYVAVGDPEEMMAVVELGETARAIAGAALADPEGQGSVEVMDLVSSTPPTRAELVRRLRSVSPELRVLWLRRGVFKPLARIATLVLRSLPLGRSVPDVAGVFPDLSSQVEAAARIAPSSDASDGSLASAPEPEDGVVLA